MNAAMWLLEVADTDNLKLKFFHETKTPPYAILSHTWLEDNDQEVSFRDIENGHRRYKKKAGFAKVVRTCKQARADGYSFCWIDTCCVDKSSSAELSEAINSMFRWYGKSGDCYAYLCDVEIAPVVNMQQFMKSRWFTRGWTLQELLAPKDLTFFGSDWRELGSKSSLSSEISIITGIGRGYLEGTKLIYRASAAERMAWASQRETTRIEDIAYSLLGLFDINMSLLYGEGATAFTRLQEEIIKKYFDQTLFAWNPSDERSDFATDILASSPKCFANGHSYQPLEPQERDEPYRITNQGLEVVLPLILENGAMGSPDMCIGLLAVRDTRKNRVLGIPISTDVDLKTLPNTKSRLYCCRLGLLREIGSQELRNPKWYTVVFLRHSHVLYTTEPEQQVEFRTRIGAYGDDISIIATHPSHTENVVGMPPTILLNGSLYPYTDKIVLLVLQLPNHKLACLKIGFYGKVNDSRCYPAWISEPDYAANASTAVGIIEAHKQTERDYISSDNGFKHTSPDPSDLWSRDIAQNASEIVLGAYHIRCVFDEEKGFGVVFHTISLYPEGPADRASSTER